jgi:hypothetical protein
VQHIELHRSRGKIGKRYWQGSLIAVFLIVLIVPAWADGKCKDEGPLRWSHSKETQKCFLD